MWLTGANRFAEPGQTFHNSISADQVAAAKLGMDTRFASLQLNGSENAEASGHGPGLSMAWDVSGKPIGGHKGPVEAFHRLFSKDTTPIEQQKAMLAQKRSVLDTVMENAKAMQRGLGKNDRAKPTGRIIRVLPPVIDLAPRRTTFNTGERTLDVLLEEARTKFSDPNPLIRRVALERLWDAWERLKSLENPSNKKNSVHLILSAVTAEPTLYARLNAEALEMTSIGNDHLIRHYEVDQKPVIDADHIDYLFHRLFAMIQMMLRKKAT